MDIGEALKMADDAWERAGFDARALSPALRVVHLIGRLEAEVLLGGVYGWLINSSGPSGPDTARALDAVGAHQCASIVREILTFFPDGAPAFDDQDRIQQIEGGSDADLDRWRDLGDRLLKWPEDIYVLLQQFVAEHEADFS